MGAVVGWLASLVMKTNARMGAIANIVVSIVGSSRGSGWPARSDCPAAAAPSRAGLVAVRGATLLILILKMVGIYK